MLTPTEKKQLIVSSLNEAQQQATAGHFSDLKSLHSDNVARVIAYFDKELPETVCKVSLSGANAILFTDYDSFKILSSPKLALDTNNHEIFVGHDGNHIFYPMLISINA